MEKQNNWRNQLRKREIAPSDEAWLAIEAGLENKAQNKIQKKYIITLIAASLIGFVVFVSLPSTSTSSPKTSIADEVNKEIQEEESAIPTALFQSSNAAITATEEEGFQQEEKPDAIEQVDIQIGNSPESSQEITVENEVNAPNEPLQVQEMQLKAADLLAEVEAELVMDATQSNFENSDAEAEALLAEAQLMIQEVDYDQLYAFAEASDLLAEVEDDLSKNNLQNRVWQFVKSNFQNLESALASLK